MAMLMTNEVFARTWGERAGPAPAEEYWPALIGRVKAAHPDLLFIAEAYWDMEWTLQQQGFDLCYDKRLYDRLAHEPAESVRGHLQADAGYQERLIRFIENHDEPRAAATFGPRRRARPRSRCRRCRARGSTTTASSRAGGRRSRSSSGRGPDEPRRRRPARVLRAAAARRRRLRPARRRRGACASARAGPTTTPTRQLVAWCWSSARVTAPRGRQPRRRARPGTGAAALGRPRGAGRGTLTDRLDGRASSARATSSPRHGLYVALDPWASHFLAFER